MRKLNKRESMNDVLNALDNSTNGVKIPDTDATLVDYDSNNDHCRLVVERKGKFKEFKLQWHSSLSSLTTAVQKSYVSF
jgi:hypothetical protein